MPPENDSVHSDSSSSDSNGSDSSSSDTQAKAPHKKLIEAVQAAEAELLDDLAAHARDGDWEVVDQLFDTLFHLHETAHLAEWQLPGNPGRTEGTPPPLDPPGGWKIPDDERPLLAGILDAVRNAEATALAEVARLAHDGEWKAVVEALPVLQELDFARLKFQE